MNQNPQVKGEILQTEESLAFWMIFAPVFVILLVASVIASMIGMQWRSFLPGAENSKGFVEGVSSAVYTLMSYII
jgi:amino acid permease